MQNRQCNTGARQSTRTVLLAAIGAFLTLLPIVAGPVGASGQARRPYAGTPSPVVVSPAEGGPTKVFSVSFTVGKAVTGNNWYLIDVKARSKKRSCEYYESVEISNASHGQGVSVELRPYDRGRWCVGRYSGAVRYQKRISCRAPDTNQASCSTIGSVTARFDFRVTS